MFFPLSICPLHLACSQMQVGVYARNGKFVVLDSLRPHFVVPEGLSECELKPYVAKAKDDAAAAIAAQ